MTIVLTAFTYIITCVFKIGILCLDGYLTKLKTVHSLSILCSLKEIL